MIVLAGSADGPVVAEVGVHDRTRRLNVRAGKYFIRARGDTHLLEGTIDVAAGVEHVVADRELARVDYVEVAAKGAIAMPRVADAVEAGALVRTALIDGGDPCVGAIAGYAISLAWLTLTPRFSACREHVANTFVATATDDVVADVRLSHAWRAAAWTFAVQVEAGGALLHQHFSTEGNAPARTSAGALFGGGGSVELALAHDFYASLAGEVDTSPASRRHGDDALGPGPRDRRRARRGDAPVRTLALVVVALAACNPAPARKLPGATVCRSSATPSAPPRPAGSTSHSTARRR